MFRVHSAHDLLGILAPMLEGEIERSEGSLDRAISAFTRAVAQYDALMYDEPEPLPFSPRHWLGAPCWRTSTMPRPSASGIKGDPPNHNVRADRIVEILCRFTRPLERGISFLKRLCILKPFVRAVRTTDGDER